MDGDGDQEFRASAEFAFNVDPAPVVLDDAAGQRQSQPRAVALGCVKRAEDEGEVLGGNTTATVGDGDQGFIFFCGDDDPDCASAFDCLHGVKQEVEDNLVHLVGVVFDIGELGIFFELDLDGFREHLLAREHDRVLHRSIEITGANIRRVRTRRLQQVSENAVDLCNLQTHIFDHRARGACGGQVAAYYLDDTGDTCERIADLMCEPGGELSQGGQVLRARHLGAMQAVDLFAALAKLLDHVIEVATQVTNLVVSLGKFDGNVQVSFAHARNLVLQLDHRTLDEIGQGDHHRRTNSDGAATGYDQHLMALGIPQGNGGHQEEQEAVQQHEGDREHGLDLPIHAYRRHACVFAAEADR